MLGGGSTFADVMAVLISIADGLMALVVGIIVVVFLWRILTAWFMGAGDPKEVERGRQSALAGIIVLVFVFGLWGIVLIIRTTFFG